MRKDIIARERTMAMSDAALGFIPKMIAAPMMVIKIMMIRRMVLSVFNSAMLCRMVTTQRKIRHRR